MNRSSAQGPRLSSPGPRTIGKYEIRRPLAAGGFGTVFEAWDPLIRRQVAVKICPSASPEIRLRFSREAEIVGNLDHPNIVRVFDFGRDGDVPYLVQEFLSGQDLGHRLTTSPPLTYPEKLLILLQVARGLEYAHQRGVVHRDVKPANVRLLDDGTAKIMDFGIATSKEADVGVTQVGTTVGTAAYLAPESIHGHMLDHRCDIFSFGVTAYEVLASRRPFGGDTISGVLFQIVNQDPEPLSLFCPDAPAALVDLIRRCLEKDRERRYASMAEVRSQLETIRDEAGLRRSTETAGGSRDDAESVDLADVTLAGVDAGPLLVSRQTAPRWRLAVLTTLLLATAVGAVVATQRNGTLGPERLRALLNRAGSPTAASPGDQFSPSPSTTQGAGAAAPLESGDMPVQVGSRDSVTGILPAGLHAATDLAERSQSPENRDGDLVTQPLPALVTLREVWSERIRVAVNEGLPRRARDARISLSPGIHVLHFSLEAPRYSARDSLTVQVGPGERLAVRCPLVPPGVVSFRPLPESPQGAVFLNGRLRGNSPLSRLVLEPGEYQLRILPRAASDAEVASAVLLVESRIEAVVSFDLRSADPMVIQRLPLEVSEF